MLNPQVNSSTKLSKPLNISAYVEHIAVQAEVFVVSKN